MPMEVPNVAEWQAEPGFETGECWCTRVCKTPVADCTACGGSGVTGRVPIGVWEQAHEKREMPRLQGDPRFDPRVRWSMANGERCSYPTPDEVRSFRWLVLGINAMICLAIGAGIIGLSAVVALLIRGGR